MSKNGLKMKWMQENVWRCKKIWTQRHSNGPRIVKNVIGHPVLSCWKMQNLKWSVQVAKTSQFFNGIFFSESQNLWKWPHCYV